MIKIIVIIIFLFTASYNSILAGGEKQNQSHIDDSELYNEATRYAGGMRSGTKDILRFLKPALWNTLTHEEKQKVTEGIKNRCFFREVLLYLKRRDLKGYYTSINLYGV